MLGSAALDVERAVIGETVACVTLAATTLAATTGRAQTWADRKSVV